jgi:hypothetical protein
MRAPFLACLVLLASGAMARLAHADAVEVCAEAATHGQAARDGGKLIVSRAAFATCTATSCPAAVRHDCGMWLTEVETRIPSVVVRVVTDDGKDAVDARATIDGKGVALDGRTTLLDPGPHIFAAFGAHGERQSSVVVVAEAERRRFVTLSFDAPPRTTTRRTTTVALFAGSGGAAIAAGIFGFIGMREWVSLQSECRPNCAEGDVSSARAKFVVADVALGVSAALLGTAIVLLLTEPRRVSAASMSTLSNPLWRF